MAGRKGKATKSAPKSSSTSRKRPSQNSTSENDIPYTSLAERKRRQPTCSMASLRELETEVTIEENFIGLFGNHSDNHYTWGKTEAKPIVATKRKRRNGALSIRELAGFPPSLFGSFDEGPPEPIIPNSPDRSPFLRLSQEIREKIYAKFLLYKRPIIMRPEWDIVENKLYRNNAILFVCKQINTEATSFLYKNNVFRTILRPPPSSFYYRETFSIEAKFLPLFKNIIISCEKENYHLEWYEKACTSIKKLSNANVALDSLTLVTFPQKVGMSDTAVGEEDNPITFADFFYANGQFMTELKKLRCKFLNIVVKKIDFQDMDPQDNMWRLLISLDLRYLHAATFVRDELANEETIKFARSKAEAVEEELMGLKEKFEEVFEDDDRAMEEGKCRLMDVDETYDNGLALATGQ